ncbi:MAG: hypothetical protein R3228_17310, partial [Halioglobus sp.]|nr:hypothetical protein [Halioglobus sp.]
VGKMRPAVDELVLYLQQTGQEQAHAFFLEVQRRLQYVSEEDDLLELFMMLSMTAFQGFALDPFGAMLADRILAYAEQVSHTFSADNDAVH